MKKIGFIGLGIMGKPMVTNLLKAGVDVTVCDLNSDAVEALVNKGAKAGTYETLANECDIIMTILPEAKIVQGILFGAGGLAALNIALPIFSIINGLALMLGMGGGARFMLRKSCGEYGEACQVFTRTVRIAAGFAGLP